MRSGGPVEGLERCSVIGPAQTRGRSSARDNPRAACVPLRRADPVRRDGGDACRLLSIDFRFRASMCAPILPQEPPHSLEQAVRFLQRYVPGVLRHRALTVWALTRSAKA